MPTVTSPTPDDDDIEFVAHSHPYAITASYGTVIVPHGSNRNKFLCQVCYVDLTSLTIPQREFHYDNHFSDEPQGKCGVLAQRYL